LYKNTFGYYIYFLFFFHCSFAATEVNGQHVNGAESELQNAMDRAAIDIVKGMISLIFFVEQF
jgi:hypothetical protein